MLLRKYLIASLCLLSSEYAVPKSRKVEESFLIFLLILLDFLKHAYFHDQIVLNDNQCIMPVNYFFDYQILPDYDDVYVKDYDDQLNLNDKFHISNFYFF